MSGVEAAGATGEIVASAGARVRLVGVSVKATTGAISATAEWIERKPVVIAALVPLVGEETETASGAIDATGIDWRDDMELLMVVNG